MPGDFSSTDRDHTEGSLEPFIQALFVHRIMMLTRCCMIGQHLFITGDHSMITIKQEIRAGRKLSTSPAIRIGSQTVDQGQLGIIDRHSLPIGMNGTQIKRSDPRLDLRHVLG